jgi:hypothetical protein
MLEKRSGGWVHEICHGGRVVDSGLEFLVEWETWGRGTEAPRHSNTVAETGALDKREGLHGPVAVDIG